MSSQHEHCLLVFVILAESYTLLLKSLILYVLLPKLFKFINKLSTTPQVCRILLPWRWYRLLLHL